MNYDFGKSLTAEQHNTLVMLDTIIGDAQLKCRPTFEILGGTALLFHGVEALFTVDIDVASKMEENVRELVDPFVSDAASEVAVLAKNYKTRLVNYPRGEFDNCNIVLLSLEDLVITKLGAYRVKDREDLKLTGVMKRCNKNLVRTICTTEFDEKTSQLLLHRLDTVES